VISPIPRDVPTTAALAGLDTLRTRRALTMESTSRLPHCIMRRLADRTLVDSTDQSRPAGGVLSPGRAHAASRAPKAGQGLTCADLSATEAAMRPRPDDEIYLSAAALRAGQPRRPFRHRQIRAIALRQFGRVNVDLVPACLGTRPAAADAPWRWCRASPGRTPLRSPCASYIHHGPLYQPG
jgi:hypothetical protein